VPNLVIGRSIAAKGCYFVLIQSNQRSSQQTGFFAAQGLCPASWQNHGLQNLAATSFAHGSRFRQVLLCPSAALPIIVLPAFAQSFFADRRGKEEYRQTATNKCDIA